MLAGHRSLFLLGALSLAFLSGCGASSQSNSYGSSAADPAGAAGTGSGTAPINTGGGVVQISGADNAVTATASVAGTASVTVGASQTVSVTFTSADGLPLTGFAVSGTLGTLPAGWSGPATFSCGLVETGSGCVLNLIYSPTAADSGTLIVNCEFVDDANQPSTPGPCLTIPYTATPPNHVIAMASPTGQIDAVVGTGTQSVSVNFTTDDGNAATNLALTTDLNALPPGWSSTASALPCAIVGTGSGCQLMLAYAPTAAARGTLTLNYTYTDNGGTVRSGGVNIPYSTASDDNLVATASPPGQVLAIEKTGGQAVAVTFTTDDGRTADQLYLTSDLGALPPGWSSAAGGFSCGSVSTGNGCQLHMTYAPTALAGGILTLNYAYTDAGTNKTGLLNIAYAATTNDNAVAKASPAGEIDAVVGAGPQAVAVTFTTDDGRPATALQLTGSLASLPAGWSSTATSFSCSGFSGGTGCQLPLTYEPGAWGSGTLSLSYSYQNNDDEPRTGTLNIPYRAMTNDGIVGTPSPASLNVATGTGTPVIVTFTTDDGNPASNLLLTSSLTALPAGWSSTVSGFTCATVSAGTACQLSLAYESAVAAGGTLNLTYSYNDDSGTAKTGAVDIAYTAM